MLLSDGRHRGERIDRGGAGRADRRHERARHAARGPIRLDRGFQQVHAQRMHVVGLDEPQVVLAEPREQRRLLDRAVGLARGVDDERRVERLQPAAVLAEVGAFLAGAEQRAQRGRAGRVVHDTRPGVGEPDHLAQPVHHDFLDLGRRGARLPAHALGAEPRRHDVGQDRRVAGVAREVGEEGRMVPVRDAPDHVLVEPLQRAGELAARAGRRAREPRPDLARLDRAHHRQALHALAVVRHPLDELVPELPESRRVHAAPSPRVRETADPPRQSICPKMALS